LTLPPDPTLPGQEGSKCLLHPVPFVADILIPNRVGHLTGIQFEDLRVMSFGLSTLYGLFNWPFGFCWHFFFNLNNFNPKVSFGFV